MSVLRMIYLGLAIAGTILPMMHFIPWLIENEGGLRALTQAWQVSGATKGLVWDLSIAAIALCVFVIAEVAVRRNFIALIAIPATFCIGVSCGLPLYLFLRTAPIRD